MKEKTEKQLCNAFMDLLGRYPFSKITIQKIASECGVNRQTVYYHYDNIYDLMKAAFEEELIVESGMYEVKSWDIAMTRLLKWMKERRFIIKNILSNTDIHYLRQTIYPLILKCMTGEYMPTRIIRPDQKLDNNFVQYFLTLGITQYILEWAESDFKESEEDIIHNFMDLLKKVYE
ncbi:MAG: TetR/AcrR family transcriptional regulator C-terminal domain-containing protein [Lachnospiraceae bacterium]|nr:TetR/AcrR family transcriptional regulator C-terminal domain-containing protein [Lachnospiraceae bacterium]